MQRLFFLIVNLFLFLSISQSWLQAAQQFELRRHFYYKIEKNGKLIGYAEEYINPIKELPNLEVEITFNTYIGTRYAKRAIPQRFKKERYVIDLTFDKMLTGEITYNNQASKQHFKIELDFKRMQLTHQQLPSGQSRAPKSIAQDALLNYHRFLAPIMEKRWAEKVVFGSMRLIRTNTGEVTPAFWQLKADTTLTINGIRLMCNHFLILNSQKQVLRELWTLTNSGRLVRSIEKPMGYLFELTDVSIKNYIETPFLLAPKKPLLNYLSATVFDQTKSVKKPIESKRLIFDMRQAQFPLDPSITAKMETWLKPLRTDSPFDSDTLFQIGTELTKVLEYLDEVLASFSRWSIQKTGLKTTLNKEINHWNHKDYQRFTETLSLFTRLCRIFQIPARFVRGVYCLSAMENLCYNWIWIEVFDGKTWYPWHIETHHEFGGAEFMRVLPVDWDYVKKFKFTPVKNMQVERYEFYIQPSLF